MIDVTRMNGSLLTVNNHLIEMVEETPDTVITLTTGKKIIVKESRQEVKNLVKLYEKEITCWRTYKLLKVIPFDNQSTGIQRGGDDT